MVAGATSHFLTDALGSPVAVANSAGVVETEYTYEPFGKTTFTGSTNSSSYQYTGRENDGTGLFYYRARYHHPTLQRFISEDPIQFNGGDVNFYGYVFNDPINWVDPDGLAKFPSDPSQIPPNWTPDPTHRDPNGQRFRDPQGRAYDFHRGRPGMPGWRGKDHWHCEDPDKHYVPGDDIPEPKPEPPPDSTKQFRLPNLPPWLPLFLIPFLPFIFAL